jgi:hypothetical protein
MAYPFQFTGPWGAFEGCFCPEAQGLIWNGCIAPRETAYWARNVLQEPASTAASRGDACAGLATVCRLQVREGAHAGIWPWLHNGRMGHGQDHNTADFIGAALVEILYTDVDPGHTDWPVGLRDRLAAALDAAITCTIRRRVRISYTNPVAMSVMMCGLAGEYLARPEWVAYAMDRLAEWRTFTEAAGTFEEFNSSTYGGVTLPHIAWLAEKAADPGLRAAALHMERLYWDHVADFLHLPSRSLALPQARCYQDHFRDTLLNDYLHRVFGADHPDWFEALVAARDPFSFGIVYAHPRADQVRRLSRRFKRPVFTRRFTEWIGRDHVGPLDQIPPSSRAPLERRREIRCLRTGRFTLGSVSEIDSWDQRRALGGYIADPAGPAVLFTWKPRITIAGVNAQDLAQQWPVAMYFNLSSVQEEGTVLACITGMPVDGGWLAGSHWRQKVAGTVPGVSIDLGFDVNTIDPDWRPALHLDGPQVRFECGSIRALVHCIGGRLAGQSARPVIDPAQRRITLLAAEGLTIDWSAPPQVNLAFVVHCGPAREPCAISDTSLEADGCNLECRAAIDGRRWALRYTPPAIGRLTAVALKHTID